MDPGDFSDDEPSDHLRFAAYLEELAQVADIDEIDVVIRILTDPDTLMAEAAVVRHVDRRATDLYLTPAYDRWAESIEQATTDHPFLVRRLHEWACFRAVMLDRPWSPDAITESSDWLQRKLAGCANDRNALTLLAEYGRTKRIRGLARTRVGRAETR
ncbi:hypothetical protein [Nocardia sp. NPDC049149]|uniref:hypothetical protein n=1 Tax=Nocardia sp. NPDC049149 TaxID=3364315 RepID=UPI0037133622